MNANGSNIEATIFNIVFFVTSSLSDVNDSIMKLLFTTSHFMPSVLSLISLLKLAHCNDYVFSISGIVSITFSLLLMNLDSLNPAVFIKSIVSLIKPAASCTDATDFIKSSI